MDNFGRLKFYGSCGGENTGEYILQSPHGGSANSSSSGQECSLPQASIASNADLEKAERKRKRDKEFRERCKMKKHKLAQSLVTVGKENKDLKIENQYLKEENTFMNQRLQTQTEELNELKIRLDNLKLENKNQNALVQILSDHVETRLWQPEGQMEGLKERRVNPNLCLENKKLEDENALLREIVKMSDGPLKLAEKNRKLHLQNKLLKVQIDALCGKIVDENRKNCEHK